jgi:hypothetical protein
MGEPTAKEKPMGKISPQTTSKHLDLGGIEAHYGALDGYTVGFEFSAHHEGPAPLFTGLSDNVCHAPLGRGDGRHLGPRPTRPHLDAPHRRAAGWAVQTLRRPHDRVSVRESVTEPAPEVQLEIAGSGGPG